MARYSLLVGAETFLTSFLQDTQEAKSSVFAQAMTFEGDASGRRIADALHSSGAIDKRILVDSYTRYFVSDSFTLGPRSWFDKDFRHEVRATSAMFGKLVQEGVGVKYTNPVGPLFVNFPARNHRKLIVLDRRVSYVGGINFSDHNFAWHDMMIRIEDDAISRHLAEAFEANWRSETTSGLTRVSDADIYLFNGVDNEQVFRGILQRVAAAKRSIEVVSPYLTFPFVQALGAAAQRGVAVTIHTPLSNNRRLVRDYLVWHAHRHHLAIKLRSTMSHLKAMLVDDRCLIFGSTNFDFVSYRCQEEIAVAVEDPELISEFRKQVLDTDHQSEDAAEAGVHVGSVARGWLGYAALHAADLCSRLNRGKASRTFDVE